MSKQEWIEQFDGIQKEWVLHRKMNTCFICDSPKGHTDIKDFISKNFIHKDILKEKIKNIRKLNDEVDPTTDSVASYIEGQNTVLDIFSELLDNN